MTSISEAATAEKRSITEDEGSQIDKMIEQETLYEKELRALIHLNATATAQADPEKIDEEKRYSDAFMNYIRFGTRNEILEKRTTQSGQNTTAATGGYTVPTTLGDQIIKSVIQRSDMLQFVTIKNTTGGGPLTYPTYDDTSNVGHWLAEETQAAQTLVTFGSKTLNALTLVSDIIPVSIQVLQDSGFNFAAEIGEVAAERLARGIEAALITGGGSTAPNGLEAAATTQGAYFAKSAITRLVVLDLIHSINRGYRDPQKCKFVMADSTLKLIKKLAIGSADDRSLWQPDFSKPEAGTIEGYGYCINDSVDAFGTAGNKPMYFGDLSQYYFRMVGGVEMVVMQERYMDFLQKGFLAYMRADGELMNTAAIKHAVCAAT